VGRSLLRNILEKYSPPYVLARKEHMEVKHLVEEEASNGL